MSKNDGSRHAGKGVTAKSVGNHKATEVNRQAGIAQAAAKAAAQTARRLKTERLLAAVHELRAAFEARYTFDGVVTIWINPCCLGATYVDASEGGLLEWRDCGPRRRSKKAAIEHHLISIALGPHEHMHCYLMSRDHADTLRAANRMLDEAEKLGCTYPLLGIVLATKLEDSVEAVRKIVAARSAEAGQLLRTATDFHLTIWGTCTDDPTDEQLMKMH